MVRTLVFTEDLPLIFAQDATGYSMARAICVYLMEATQRPTTVNPTSKSIFKLAQQTYCKQTNVSRSAKRLPLCERSPPINVLHNTFLLSCTLFYTLYPPPSPPILGHLLMLSPSSRGLGRARRLGMLRSIQADGGKPSLGVNILARGSDARSRGVDSNSDLNNH